MSLTAEEIKNADVINILRVRNQAKYFYVNGFGAYEELVLSGGSGGASIYPEGTLYYFALLSQTGTSAPEASGVVTNFPNGSISYGYTNVGTYTVNSSGLFLANKTYYFLQQKGTNIMGVDFVSTNILRFRTNAANSFSVSNDILSNTPFELIIFP